MRSSIKIRKAGDEVEAEPGFFEGDTVAHCGPTLKGEFARTLNLTDVHTGWVFTRTVCNNAHVHILGALKAGVTEVPFAVTGLDFDNGTEFLNHAVIKWAGKRETFFTRSRPCKKNDQATIESKNNHLVRNYGFYYRYDTDEERAVLNRLWRLVNDRFNYLTPTKKRSGSALTATADAPAATTIPPRRWPGYSPPTCSPAPRRPNSLHTATASTPPPPPDRSPTCKPSYSNSPKTKPSSSTSPASPPRYPMSAKASESRPADTPVSRAYLGDARINLRGQFDLMHYAGSRVNP